MNSLLKQLSEQALENSLFETIEPTMTVGEGENKVTIPLVFAKKFAELIVKECAGVELYWLSEQDRKAVAGKIKEHFGVEE